MHDDALARLAARTRGGGIVAGRLRGGATEITVHGEADAAWAYELGSLTKVYNSRLLLALEAQGVVSRGDLLADCLPSPPWQVPGGITLEQLATHRAGLPRLSLGLMRASTDKADPYRSLDLETLQRAVARVRSRPWRRGRYSNLGAALLGHALAARGGASWEELLRREVLDPLGLADTGTDPAPPLAQPHRRGAEVPPWTMPQFLAAGALRSTVHDQLRFLAAELEAAEPALGWQRRGPLLWHNGGTGGSASMAAIDPGRREAIVLLANAAIAGPLTSAGVRLIGMGEPAARRGRGRGRSASSGS